MGTTIEDRELFSRFLLISINEESNCHRPYLVFLLFSFRGCLIRIVLDIDNESCQKKKKNKKNGTKRTKDTIQCHVDGNKVEFLFFLGQKKLNKFRVSCLRLASI